MNSLCNNTALRIVQNILSWKNRKKMAEMDNPLSTLIIGYTAAFINNIEKFKELLPKIKASTYVFGGDEDIVFGEKEFQETADLIPNGNLFLFRGQGHLVMIFKCRTFKKRLLEVLNA